MKDLETFDDFADQPKGGQVTSGQATSGIMVEDAKRPKGAEVTNGNGSIKGDTVNVVEDSSPTARPLFNGRGPLYTLKSERPEHRVVIMLAATGMGNKEMSEHLSLLGYKGYTAQAIGYIKKQPWAVKQIVEEIERAGREPVRILLQGAALDAAQQLTDLCTQAESEMVRKQASEAILDRAGFGKNINITTKQDPSEMTDEQLKVQVERELRTVGRN